MLKSIIKQDLEKRFKNGEVDIDLLYGFNYNDYNKTLDFYRSLVIDEKLIFILKDKKVTTRYARDIYLFCCANELVYTNESVKEKLLIFILANQKFGYISDELNFYYELHCGR